MTGMNPEEAPRFRPLTYPGQWPDGDTLVTFSELVPLPDDDVAVDRLLAERGAETLASRYPVLAIGSNASPAQLRAKFIDAPDDLAIPQRLEDVSGVGVGYAALLTRFGYVPATVFPGDGARLFVQYLTATQIAALDATEYPYYKRVWLPASIVMLSGGHGCYAYVAEGALGAGTVLTMPTPGRSGTDQPGILSFVAPFVTDGKLEVQAVRDAGLVGVNAFEELPDEFGRTLRAR